MSRTFAAFALFALFAAPALADRPASTLRESETMRHPALEALLHKFAKRGAQQTAARPSPQLARR